MITKLEAKNALRWLRLETEERERTAAESFTVPSWTQVKDEVSRRDVEAMTTILTFVDEQ